MRTYKETSSPGALRAPLATRHRVTYVMSTNYAGSTVLGLVLGSHQNGMFLGEPSMIVRRDELGRWKHKKFCSICQEQWRERCPVWKPSLVAQIRESPGEIYDLLAADWPRVKFFVDASKNLPWLDNGVRGRQIDGAVVHISKDVYRYTASVLTRRGRFRFIESIGLDWAKQNAAIRANAEKNGLPYLHIKYSDFVNRFDEVLAELGEFIGFDPEATQRDFWTHSHHYIKGNPGAVTHFDPSRIATEPGLNRALYKENHRTIFLDDKWKELLTHRDMLRLASLPEVRRQSEILQLDPPPGVGPTIATRARGRIVSKTIHALHRMRSLLSSK